MGDASTELVTAIDASHGGRDGGTTCYRGILRESDLTIAIARAAKRRRPELFMIRLDDETLRLRHRNAKAITGLVDLVIAVHLDFAEDEEGNRIPERHGLAAFYWRGNGVTRDLARCAINSAPTELRGGRVWDQDYSSGVRAVLGAYRASCVLIEAAFLSSERDVGYAHTTEGIEAIAGVVLDVDDRFREIMGEIT